MLFIVMRCCYCRRYQVNTYMRVHAVVNGERSFRA